MDIYITFTYIIFITYIIYDIHYLYLNICNICNIYNINIYIYIYQARSQEFFRAREVSAN